MNLVLTARPSGLPLVDACRALNLNRSSVYAYQRRQQSESRPAKRSRQGSDQPRALSPAERENVLQTLHSEPFQDQPPGEVYAQLLEQGIYLCSVSTMHRLLRRAHEHGERRAQRPAQHHAVPRLLAYQPNRNVSTSYRHLF